MKKVLLSCVMLAGCAVPTRVSDGGAKLYYSYDQEELSLLPEKHAGGEQATAAQLMAWDVRLMDTARRLRLPPTLSGKLYANVAVAQRDALLLGAQAPGIDAVGATVACDIVPASCEQLRTTLRNEPRDLAIAMLVARKAGERKARELEGKVVPEAPEPGPGVWSDVSATTPDAGSWLLFGNDSFVAFPPPPPYGSAEDLEQVAAVKKAVQHLTEWQEERLEYWAGGLGTETPSGIWLGIAHQEILAHGMADVGAVANLRASLTAAMADAFVNCWRTKFTYWTARPSKRDTSIALGTPLPLFPSYPSGHSTISGAAAAVLSAAFPKNAPRFAAIAREAADSRLWGGIHFPVDNEQGLVIGTEIGTRVLKDKRFAL